MKRLFCAAALAAAAATSAVAVPAGADDAPLVPPLDPADCSDGTYVAQPGINPGPVADCLTLVAVRNHFMSNPANAGLDWDSPWRGTTTRGGRVVWLSLSGEQLSGTVPPQLGDLAYLEHLDLHENQLSGPIPAQLGNLSRLEVLDLHENQLSGPIPAQLANLSRLHRLLLHENQLSGPIPPQLGDLTALEYLYLHQNQLSGPVPAQLANLANLEFLQLHGNQLSGSIPAGLTHLIGLSPLDPAGCSDWTHVDDPDANPGLVEDCEALVAIRNHFMSNPANTGIDWSSPWRGTTTKGGRVVWLDLSGDQLYGAIPAQIGDLARLEHLDLQENELSGPIPPQLGSLTRLEHMDLHGNRLSGSIPAQFGNLGRLTRLFLQDNRLSGPIPAQFNNLFSLQQLYLQKNELSGPIPARLGNLVNLKFLDISDNRLSGQIPATLKVSESFRFCPNSLLRGPLPIHLRTVADFSGDIDSVESSCHTGSFSDDDGSVHESNIELIAEWEITLGCGINRFCPSRTVTRSQMAAFLYRAFTRLYGAPDLERQEPVLLTDVTEAAWYRPFAHWAVANEVIRTQGVRFDPFGPVTRADMADMLVGTFAHLEPSAELQGLFSDTAGTRGTTIRAMEGIYDAGVTSGCATEPLRYCPTEAVTREQMASFLVRAVRLAPSDS